ncbi:acsf3 [Symbiodinium microadriaticum]|nr:acsf3 [Symbiodinium microadriaticum]
MIKMRLMVSGSAALPVSVLQKWREISGHTLLERYGMTEIGMAISNPYKGQRRPGFIGQPLPGVEVRLIDDEGEIITKEQESGEILVKGPGVFKEYWEKPDATSEAFTEDGWFKTGDVALIRDGSYKILGRKSADIIKSGGYKLSALEIEESIRTFPNIQDCAVVGIADVEWGEIVAAAIQSEVEIDPEVIKAFLKEKLPGYKELMEIVENLLIKNGLVTAFLTVGLMILIANWISKKVFRERIPGVALAITAALILAYFGGEKGIADFPLFTGMALLGGSMLRDFTIVATAMGASLEELKKTGIAGIVSLFAGITITFFLGVVIGYAMGYNDPVSLTTIGAGACTYIVGPVTGGALGASSELIAISVAAGVIKTIFVTIITPAVAKFIGLDNPQSAMVFGGLIGTTSGVAAGLAATDPKLVYCYVPPSFSS